MKLISFDVGIKNLAYCVLECNNNNVKILKWNCISLIEQFKCHEPNCDKGISLKNDDVFWCNKHAKQNKITVLPKSCNYMKVADIKKLCIVHDIDTDHKKCDLINLLRPHVCYPVKQKKVKHESLVSISIQLQKQLDEVYQPVDVVLIENQITSKMRCLQVMLLQYFIGKNIDNVVFVSAIHKLSDFIPNFNKTKTITYKDRKSYAISTTRAFLKDNTHYCFMDSHKKKDDLADCFLQGMWYMHKNNKTNELKLVNE
jgi:hypothetical protein